MKIETHTLPNNIRLVHVPDKSDVAYLGAIINTGTRDELTNESGLAHLTEHMLFKGTSKRNSTLIINRIEDVGGDLNAYTAKEETVIYSVFLKKYIGRVFELISDILFDSIFNDNELQKEIDVVIDEIHSYLDSPAELIIDDFEDELFNNHSIGRNILGNEQTLKTVTSENLKDFVKRTYTTDQIVFFSLGNFPFDKIIRLAEKHLSKIPQSKRNFERTVPINYSPRIIEKNKKTLQTHYVLGNRAFCIHDKERFGFYLLNNILGGQGMNSRLNMSLRERNGLVYTIESQFSPFSDTGEWNIYFGTDHEDVKKALRLISKELNILKDTKLSEKKLVQAKRQLLSQMTIAGENKESWIINTAKNYSVFNDIETKEEIEKKIMSVSSDEILSLANTVFCEDKFTHLHFF